MKHLLLVLTLALIPFLATAQQTLYPSITHDGGTRDYILYVPANYTGNEPVPLIFNFHGYTSNATEQMWYGDFRAIADTAGFIVVHPEGAIHAGAAHWNVGGWIIGSPYDDVSFTEALLDTLASTYNINLDRVYSTGMSNGGFMSFLLACQLSDKIAAVASVTGSMTPVNYNACNPQRPVPVMQIHGTTDPVVPYLGAVWTKPVNSTVQYWVDHNHCSPFATTTALPNISTTDGSTAEHFFYAAGENGATVEHFKVTGSGHTWPGSAINNLGTNYDFDASAEIWRFFSQYDKNGAISTDIDELDKINVQIYPNPTQSFVHIELADFQQVAFKLTTLTGQTLSSGVLQSSHHELSLAHLPQGMYLLAIGNLTYKIQKTE